jgi:FAD/FMN-containing dehydrogenase
MGRLYVASYAVWSDPTDDAANADWHRTVTGALAPFAAGYYAGESDVIGDPERARRSYTPVARARLAGVRRTYDPGGVFHSLAAG